MQNKTFSGLNLRLNLIVLQEVSSTNDYLKELLSNIKPLAEGTAIMARDQKKGKGQRGNTWLSNPGENLTVSFLLYPKNLSIHDAFNLNILISLGVLNWLTHYVKDVSIKWPNDIYIGKKKVGGILIENQLLGSSIKSSIVGIGINVNQETFPEELNNRATSLNLEMQCEQALDIETCCREMLSEIFTLYKQINLTSIENLITQYTAALFRVSQPSQFVVKGKQIEGTIRGVDRTGRLIVLVNNIAQHFDLKEIRFII